MLSIAYCLGFGLITAFLALKFERRRVKMKEKQRGFFRSWPIPQISVRSLDHEFPFTHLGPALSTGIHFLPNIQVNGGISDLETWILCTLSKKMEAIFEFGTCSGKTTYLLARNAQENAKIVTLTLHPQEGAEYKAASDDEKQAKTDALKESAYSEFYYTKTPEEKKVIQLYGDSKSFDETPYISAFDLVFVDGSHAYSYVMSDSQKAFRMVKPGGFVIWHDYRGPKRNRDVFNALNAIAQERPLVHVKGTSLVLYKNS